MTRLAGDVVFSKFCLHEMADPTKALDHARTLAPDLVVYDHSPGSEWIYLGAEDVPVLRSAAAMERFGIRRQERFLAEQRFRTFEELMAKMTPQGQVAIQRIQRFSGAKDIVIPMAYELVLL